MIRIPFAVITVMMTRTYGTAKEFDSEEKMIEHITGHLPQFSNCCCTCNRTDFHWGGCADQNALLDYPYGKHPIPYPLDAPHHKRD
jgi:hypothetical protein